MVRQLATYILVVGLALLALVAPGAANEDPLGLRARIDALVRARIPNVERIEMPSLARLAPSLEPADLARVRSEVTPAGRLRSDRLGLRVSSWLDGRLLKRGTITVRVHATREVAVTTRSLRARELIQDGDFEYVATPLSEVRDDSLFKGAEIEGRRATRSLRGGQLLRAAFVESSPAVVRGQRVKLRIAHNGLRIEAQGRAQEDGRRGEWIRVLNQNSKREVLGRVAGEGLIHVDL